MALPSCRLGVVLHMWVEKMVEVRQARLGLW